MRRPSTPISAQRKKRDSAIRSIDERIAEHLEQARATGELQSAQSYGKLLVEMAGHAQTPGEFRLPFKILKNAEVPPPEIALFHQRATLRQQLAQCATEPERVAVDVTAVLADGRREHIFIAHAIGSLQRPMSDADLNAKFHALADPVLGQPRSAALIAALWGTGSVADMRPVLRLAAT